MNQKVKAHRLERNKKEKTTKCQEKKPKPHEV